MKAFMFAIAALAFIFPAWCDEGIRETATASADSAAALKQGTAEAAQDSAPATAVNQATAEAQARTCKHNEQDDTSMSTYARTTRMRYSNYIGISGGYVTGYGISLRKWFNGKWGFEINLFPLYFENNYPENDENGLRAKDSGYTKEGRLSLGLTYLKTIAELHYARFVFYTGGNLLTKYKKWDYYYTEDDPLVIGATTLHDAGRTLDNKISVGAGAGCEWYVWRFAFHCMLGFYGAYFIEREGYAVSPSIEGGVHFRL